MNELAKFIWYDAEDERLFTNVFYDAFWLALRTDMIPNDVVLIGEL